MHSAILARALGLGCFLRNEIVFGMWWGSCEFSGGRWIEVMPPHAAGTPLGESFRDANRNWSTYRERNKDMCTFLAV